jgi:predicted CopG family antitoxin
MKDNRESMQELKGYKRNIKIDLLVWNALNNMKGKNETFNDVIMGLLKMKTESIGNDNMKLLKYSRRTMFVETTYKSKSVGIEFEYNDVKNEQSSFTIDVCFRKIFYEKEVLNPSEFFGIDSKHKHLYHAYLNLYMQCVSKVLEKEFRIFQRMNTKEDFENIALWRKLYYEYVLSEESFVNDVQKPLSLSVKEMPKESYQKEIEKSIAFSIWH